VLNYQVIVDEPDYLSPVTKMLVRNLLKRNYLYQLEVINSGDTIAAKLDAASGTPQGQFINALVKQIQSFGGQYSVEIRGDEDALWYSIPKELDEILNEMFFVLYDFKAYLDPSLGSGKGVVPSQSLWGDWAATGQRCVYTNKCLSCGCLPCSGKLSTCSQKKMPRHWLDVAGCN